MITRHLAEAGLTLMEAVVTAQHTPMAERSDWLSIPVSARPDDVRITWLVVVVAPSGGAPA